MNSAKPGKLSFPPINWMMSMSAPDADSRKRSLSRTSEISVLSRASVDRILPLLLKVFSAAREKGIREFVTEVKKQSLKISMPPYIDSLIYCAFHLSYGEEKEE